MRKSIRQALSNHRARRTALWIASAVNALLLLLLYTVQPRLAERSCFTGGLVCPPRAVFAVPLALLLEWSAIDRDRVAVALNVVAAVVLALRVTGFNVPLGITQSSVHLSLGFIRR